MLNVLQFLYSVDRLWQAGALNQKEDQRRDQHGSFDQVGWNRDFKS